MARGPLTFRQRVALTLSPLVLRVVLAATFLWAGATKFSTAQITDPQRRADLITAGIAPPPEGIAAADVKPEMLDPNAATSVTGIDLLRLTLHRAANPKPIPAAASVEEGVEPAMRTPIPIWPAYLATPTASMILAWAVVATELLAAVLVLVGLLTRFAAIGLGATMLGALWLTAIGPAIQSGNAVLGFLPNHAWNNVEAWKGPFWNLALLAMAKALFLSGAGAFSLDAKLFGRSNAPDDTYDDDE